MPPPLAPEDASSYNPAAPLKISPNSGFSRFKKPSGYPNLNLHSQDQVEDPPKDSQDETSQPMLVAEHQLLDERNQN